ncbi:Hypothetical predicted protein [Paramuricea clavata]|uniref:Uncharacterized protein n=1 Tax=Paramuricea clavata TaxID=317549 RepID=A0A7D9HGE0_PARCT|nr:Hypothetical predicted protein [Paramuricea clavata]
MTTAHDICDVVHTGLHLPYRVFGGKICNVWRRQDSAASCHQRAFLLTNNPLILRYNDWQQQFNKIPMCTSQSSPAYCHFGCCKRVQLDLQMKYLKRQDRLLYESDMFFKNRFVGDKKRKKP